MARPTHETPGKAAMRREGWCQMGMLSATLKTVTVGFLAVFMGAAVVGVIMGRWQPPLVDEAGNPIDILELAPDARARLTPEEKDTRADTVRRWATHVLIFACLGLTVVTFSQRAASGRYREKARRWRALYHNLRDERRVLHIELRERGPHVVQHSRDKKFSALCARCGCVITQRFATRAAAASDRARTETEGCLACPSEAAAHKTRR